MPENASKIDSGDAGDPGVTDALLWSHTGPFRQRVLILYLSSSALTAPTVAWALYDGTGVISAETGDAPDAPYASGLEALTDGWRLLGMSALRAYSPGTEYTPGFLKHEFIFEKIVPLVTAGGA